MRPLLFLYWLVLGYLITAAAGLLAILMGCIISHALENDEAHPYSGFTPEYHTAHIDDTLPL